MMDRARRVAAPARMEDCDAVSEMRHREPRGENSVPGVRGAAAVDFIGRGLHGAGAARERSGSAALAHL